MMEQNNMTAVIEAAREGAKVQTLSQGAGYHLGYVPRGQGGQGQIISSDFERFLPSPRRAHGSTVVFDAGSLNLIMAQCAGHGDCVIYVDRNPENPQIVAVMNDHGPEMAGWRDLRCTLTFRQTPEFTKWRSIDGKLLAQAEFAEFIEDNLRDIASPPGASMLGIAQYFDATRDVSFRSAVRLKDGQVQFRNEEKIEAKVGAGTVAVPDMIDLGIAPYYGTDPHRIPSRFRYRIRDGKLFLGIKMERIETLVADVVANVVAAINPPQGAVLVDGLAPAS